MATLLCFAVISAYFSYLEKNWLAANVQYLYYIVCSSSRLFVRFTRLLLLSMRACRYSTVEKVLISLVLRVLGAAVTKMQMDNWIAGTVLSLHSAAARS